MHIHDSMGTQVVILLNSIPAAGVIYDKPFLECTPEEVKHILDVNVRQTAHTLFFQNLFSLLSLYRRFARLQLTIKTDNRSFLDDTMLCGAHEIARHRRQHRVYFVDSRAQVPHSARNRCILRFKVGGAWAGQASRWRADPI
jgi:hypothetical protein